MKKVNISTSHWDFKSWESTIIQGVNVENDMMWHGLKNKLHPIIQIPFLPFP